MCCGVFSWTADLVFPRTCAGCRRSGYALCPDCHVVEAFWSDHDMHGVPVAAAGWYRGPLRTALLAYKERGRHDLVRPLADLLAAAVATLPTGTLVPMPSTRRATRARGGNHVRRLVRHSAGLLGMAEADPLFFRRTVDDSAGLSALERSQNLTGAIGARAPRLPAQRAVLVDDVLTTGASAGAALAALRAAGWQVAGIAVLARTPLLSHSASISSRAHWPLARPRGPG